MNVEKVNNGYILLCSDGEKEIHKTLEEVFDRMLLMFEGRGRFFGGSSFGKVIVLDKPNEQSPEVDPAMKTIIEDLDGAYIHMDEARFLDAMTRLRIIGGTL